MAEGREISFTDEPRLIIAAALATIALLSIGYTVGRFTAPGSDIEYVVQADRVRQAQVSGCVASFDRALELYKNTNERAFAQLKAEHERSLAEVRAGHDEDLKVMKLAVVGCDSGRVAH